LASSRATGLSDCSIASSRCSVEMYSSVSCSASRPAASRIRAVDGAKPICTPSAYTFGLASSSASTLSRSCLGTIPS
jgi:hypothetical protein